jgi:hypothetical protein
MTHTGSAAIRFSITSLAMASSAGGTADFTYLLQSIVLNAVEV